MLLKIAQNLFQIDPQTLLKLIHKSYSNLLKIYAKVTQSNPEMLLKIA